MNKPNTHPTSGFLHTVYAQDVVREVFSGLQFAIYAARCRQILYTGPLS